jgi:hypothetical protein
MNPKHQEKIDELTASIAATLRVTAQRLYHSGAVDTDQFNPDEYVLAKLLVTAAMFQHADDFAPLYHSKYKDDLENLKHFWS